MENVEKTIDTICNWIQNRLNSDKCDINHDVQEMVKALAVLVSASARKF